MTDDVILREMTGPVAGLDIALACDFIVAAPEAAFGHSAQAISYTSDEHRESVERFLRR